MTVLIAGCGYVGTPLARALAARGESVFALRRTPKTIEHPGQGSITPIALDLTDGPATREALVGRGVDRMVYLVSPDERSDDAYEQAYVRALGTTIAALPCLRRAVLVTSTGVYDTVDDGRWVDEGTFVRGERFTARRLIEGERLLEARVREPVSLRLGGIYGPERTRMVRSVVDGSAERPATERFTNRIHVEDAARAALHLLDSSVTGVFVGVDTDPAPLGAVQEWIARRAGVAPPPVSSDEGSSRRGNKRCSSARLVRSGFRHQYPSFREGYGPIVDALVAKG